MTYTALAVPEGEARVAADLDRILAAVRAEAASDPLVAVFLIGGYARGEGAVVRGDDGEPRGFNDYDLLLLFADTPAVAEAIFQACQRGIAGEPLILDVPENNPAALELADAHHMKRTFATARMYRKGLPDLAHGKVFGITSFELG